MAIVIGIVALIAVIAGAGLLYVNQGGGTTNSHLSVHAKGPLESLQAPSPYPAPDYEFQNNAGEPVRFADFKGKVTVVNLWATWCAPCKLEMPTLAALAKRYEGRDDFQVVVISMDTDRAQQAARDFIAEHPPLAYYSDKKFQLAFEFPGEGKMPQTVILDRDARVVAVMVGEADWNGEAAVALIEDVLK